MVRSAAARTGSGTAVAERLRRSRRTARPRAVFARRARLHRGPHGARGQDADSASLQRQNTTLPARPCATPSADVPAPRRRLRRRPRPDRLGSPPRSRRLQRPHRPAPPRRDGAEAASDSVVVLFFGDSLTAGYGLANPGREAYPALVGDSLRAAGCPARVVNAGNSGETSAGGLRRVDWVLSRTTPDVFVLALGANDGLRGQPVGAMKANLAAILDKVKAAAPNARLVVAGVATLPNYGAEYGEQFRAVFPARRAGGRGRAYPVPARGRRRRGPLNQGDQVHPTAAGRSRSSRGPSRASSLRSCARSRRQGVDRLRAEAQAARCQRDPASGSKDGRVAQPVTGHVGAGPSGVVPARTWSGRCRTGSAGTPPRQSDCRESCP